MKIYRYYRIWIRNWSPDVIS